MSSCNVTSVDLDAGRPDPYWVEFKLSLESKMAKYLYLSITLVLAALIETDRKQINPVLLCGKLCLIVTDQQVIIFGRAIINCSKVDRFSQLTLFQRRVAG